MPVHFSCPGFYRLILTGAPEMQPVPFKSDAIGHI
jgi:hypothetical protein